MNEKFVPKRDMNSLLLGKPGKGYHTKTFKEGEFKQELAPSNAKIEYIQIDGEKHIRMTY